jgi:hypothetical protein
VSPVEFGPITLYKCVGDYFHYLITSNKELPSVIHIIPLALKWFYTAPGDQGPTVYPASTSQGMGKTGDYKNC